MSTTPNLAKNDLIRVFVMLAIAALGWIVPAVAPITPIGMRVIFVFLAVVVGWTISPDAWPSFIGLLLFPLTGVVTFKEFVAMGWGTDTMMFMVFTFALISFLEYTGFSKFVAAWMMSRSFIQGHPWRLIFMILFSALMICAMVHTFIGMFLMWEIVYNITRYIGQKPYDKFPSIMVFGIAMIGATALTTMPWGGNAIVNLGVYANIAGEPANILRYIGFTIPYAVVSIFVYLLLVKFVFRLDTSVLTNFKPDMVNKDDLKVTFEIKASIIFLISFIALLLLPSLLPKGSAVVAFINRFGMAGTLIFMFAVLSFVTHNNKKIFNFPELATKGINWNMIAMIAVILGIGGCIMNEKTGIAPYLNQTLVPMLSGLPTVTFVFVLIAIVVFLTNFLINMVVVAMFLPLVIPMAPQLGLNAELLSYVVMCASTVAILTPAGCAAASILFPNKKWIKTGDIYKYGVPTVIGNTLLLIAFYFVYMLIY